MFVSLALWTEAGEVVFAKTNLFTQRVPASQGYTGISGVKGTCCSCRGPVSIPNTQVRWLTTICDPSFRDPTSFSDLGTGAHTGTHTYM